MLSTFQLTINTGDWVFWNDPENHLCSTYATVVRIADDERYEDTMVVLNSPAGSTIECYLSEISDLDPRKGK